MNHLQFTLNELEVPGVLLEEALRVLVNSILLTRQTASVGLTQVTSECGISYITFKDPELKEDVELKVKLFANLLKSKHRAIVSLTFEEGASCQAWEQWNCPLRIGDTEQLREGLRSSILEIIQNVCSHSTHIPFRKTEIQGKFPFSLSYSEVDEQFDDLRRSASTIKSIN
mmetsp:Transcript_31715/g.54822  ORF Transcript_31715/g.54822 Transcript_31715/m.54822 type:complete len:171 (+) Transcript_31715:604-1116(+)